MMKLKTFLCVVVGTAAAWAFGTSPANDALVFDLGLSVPEAGQPVTKANVYDALTHSAAKRKTAASVSAFSGATDVCGTPTPISIEMRDVAIPFYSGVSNRVPVLTMAQPVYSNETDGALYVYRQGVKFNDMPLSSNMTVYLRMYIDKSQYDAKYNGMDERLIDCGWSPGNGTSTAPSGWALHMRTDVGYQFSWFRFDYGCYAGASFGGYVKLTPGQHGHWFDVVVVIRTDDAEQRSYMNLYAWVDGSPFQRQPTESTMPPQGTEIALTGFNETLGKVLACGNKTVLIGNESSGCGKTAWEKISQWKDRKGLRGGVSRVRIYDRPLTRAEVYGVVSEANGGAALAGTANDSADEFACADETPAEVFNPYTMLPARMRGRLTAEHPSLAIDVPSKGSDAGLPKAVTVKPVLSALGSGSSTVSLAVNGVTVGTRDLSKPAKRTFYVRGRNVATNANGCVRYTLTRTGDLSGTLGIDAVAIAGSWGEGVHHLYRTEDPTDVWRNYQRGTGLSTVGYPYATQYLDQVVYGPSPTSNGSLSQLQATELSFYVPEEIATELDTAYVFGFRYNDRGRDAPVLDMYLNGSKFCTKALGSANSALWYTAYTNVFEAGTLKAGMNSLVLSNASTYAQVQGLDYFATIYFDYHRFTFKPPRTGFVLLCR